MLSYTEIKKGTIIVYENEPYEILEHSFLRMQQRKAVAQTKMKNLINGKILSRNFQASDYFEEANIERKEAIFIYANRGEYWFHEKGDPRSRFSLKAEAIGEGANFLKPQTEVEMVIFNGRVINVIMPIKIDFKVIEAPPAIRGNTAQGGSKQITLEGGVKISAPLFIEEGDIVKINTQTGEYVERAEKN
ncbi:MAG: elongation factor P [Patescibacteria group bacterium]|nr:elongation factor P [Patescibacteria group bacterium]